LEGPHPMICPSPQKVVCINCYVKQFFKYADKLK
jgi:hypothetical protein